MIEEMKKAELPKPIFKNEREDFCVTFYNGEYPELYPEELIENKEKDLINQKNVTVNVTANVTGSVTVKLNNTEQRILKILQDNPNITQEQLANILKVTPMTIKRNTSKLKEKGILERIGADKNGYWKINI